MLSNSPTNTFNFKKFPRVIPPDPVKRGRGRERRKRGEVGGKGGDPPPQFIFLAAPLVTVVVW